MRLLLFILISLVALTAIPSGLLLIAKPDGILLGLAPGLLDYTPFQNYLLPGIFLAIIIGGSSLLSIFLLLDRNPHAYRYSMFSGFILLAWMVVQMLLSVGYYDVLQGLFLVIGVLITLLSYQLMGKVAA
jgi:hypothetical protein